MLLGNTNWNLYRAFVTAYETQNLHKTAEILGVSRSAVQQNIKELSNQLGFSLFMSHSKGVEPTDKAREIYPQIKNAIESLIAVEQLKETDTLKIAVGASSAELFVKLYLKEFYTKNPEIQLEINKRESIDLLKQKQLDFIIDPDHDIDKTIFKTTDLFSLSGAFVATKEIISKYNLNNSIQIEDLIKLPIISRKGAWDEFLRITGLKSDVSIIQSASTDMTVSMAQDSIAIALMPRELIKLLPNSNLVELDVSNLPDLPLKILCGYTKTLSKPAKAFVNGLISFFQSRQ